MKTQFYLLGMAALLGTAQISQAADGDFSGAKPAPFGNTAESVGQLQISFPEEMIKRANQEPFKVVCSPEAEGFSSWANNNQIWTYNFKAKPGADEPRLAGGSQCQVTQIADLQSVNGTTWKSGSIQYPVSIAGPNVVSITPAFGFKGSLRETDPVLLIAFDGPVDADKFFASQDAYFSYTSSNAPSEKIPLVALPADKLEETFKYFKKESDDSGLLKFKDHTWILATAKQSLIPGAQVQLVVENQSSLNNPSVHADVKFTRDLSVRTQFQADVVCAHSGSDTSTCMPHSPISVDLNGMVKWGDIRDAYIEYVPYKSADHHTVRSYATIAEDRKIGFWDDMLNRLSHYFPFLAKYSDTVLNSVEFDVNIEPQTQAKIVLPTGIQDLDGRALSNAIDEFRVRIAAMSEFVRTPKALSFFEKTVTNLYLPVGVVNQNQDFAIRRSGSDAKAWAPLTDPASMIRLVRAYQERGDTRDQKEYVSPMVQAGLTTNVMNQKLTGTKNRPTVLQFPFGAAKAAPGSGLYPIEISSPTFEEEMSDPAHNSYYNPKYVLAQVTDLTVHLKKGAKSTVAWVTRLSNAQPVAGAQLSIFNCLGEQKATLTTDSSGLVTFPNQNWAKDCQAPKDSYSDYFTPEQFYVFAKKGDDVALVHSSWISDSGYAFAAPGIEYFESDVRDNQPYYHAVIGVNLVKPGQEVPVELIAKLPIAHGFQEVAAPKLPVKARIVNSDDENVFFEFPLTWNNGKADFSWKVPADSAVVQLGRYQIELLAKNADKDEAIQVSSGDIEVAEFKVPLMSGILAFPTQPLVQPTSIPVNAVVRYANGVGAKGLGVDLAYYFTPSSMTNPDLPDFTFGTGPMTTTDVAGSGENRILPGNSRPADLQGLSTGADGSITKDLAQEKVSDGRSIAEVLNSIDRPQKLVVRLRYQDQGGEFQTLSQSKDIYNSQVYVGTNLVAGPRAQARLQAAAVDVNGKIVTSAEGFDYKLVRVETRVIGEELFGGMIKNTLERELKDVRWVPTCTPSGKLVSCSIGALKEGTYAFQVSAKGTQQSAHSVFKVDSDGRVYGPNDYYNFGDDEGLRQLPLALDKKNYQSGDQATVSFSAPFKSCMALVTLERSDVMKAFVVPGACDKGQVKVPVDASMAPNAFVSVYAVTGRAAAATKVGERDLGRPTYRLGFANLQINWSRFRSNVTVKTDKAKYEPRDTVNVAVAVNPEEGKLAGGTVTLIAIEEKILELKKNDTYQILNALMQMRADNVQTVTALERIETATGENSDLPGDAGDRKGGDEGGDGSSKSDFKRKLFNALVSFQPNVPVVNGVAKASFKTNDSLTRFKIFAVATDGAQKFGEGEAEYLTEKDTQTYSNLPAVAHAGDTYPVQVTVQNNTGKAQKFKVVVTETVRDANGKVIGTHTYTKEASIGSSGSQAVAVGNAQVSEDAGRVDYVVQVFDESGKLVDELQPDSQTVLAAVPLAIHDSLLSQMEGSTLTKILVKDADALPGKGALRVTATKSLVTGALTQISQRLDRDLFADFFLETRFDKAMLHASAAKPEELKAVLESMLGYNDSAGFLKYTPQSYQGDLWLTATVINTLGQEPWAMKLVPAALLQKWASAVGATLDKTVPAEYVGNSPMDWLDAQVVMGQAAFALHDADLIAQAKALDAAIQDGLARDPLAYGQPVMKWSNSELVERWLLQVLASPAKAMQSDVYKLLTGPSRLVYAGNMAQLNGSPCFHSFYTDETLETSKLLYGHSLLKGPSALAKNMALGLVNANVHGWYNSSTMVGVAESLRSFGRQYEADVVTGVVNIEIPEQNQSVAVDLTQKAAGGFASDWSGPKATVQFKHDGPGKPWVSIQALSAVPLTAPRGQGISIEKTVHNMTRDSGYEPGDVLEITLALQASTLVKKVALNDPIPAGSNIIGEAYGDLRSGQKSYSGYKMYFDELPNGISTVKYQVQLNNPGTFKMPPTRAEGLFMPSLFAETPNADLKVE